MSQNTVKDQFILPIPILGGVDELGNLLEQSSDEFETTLGVFPQFSGMLARLPGKVAIGKEDSPVRAIHQSFVPYGALGFYIESDRLVFFNHCRNPYYRIDPPPPDDLGVGLGNFTLDVFGNDTRNLTIPLVPPNLNFSPVCAGGGEIEPPIDPGNGNGTYLLDLGNSEFNSNPADPEWVYFALMDGPGAYLDVTVIADLVLERGIDYDTGDTVDFSALVLANPSATHVYIEWDQPINSIFNNYVFFQTLNDLAPTTGAELIEYPRPIRIEFNPLVLKENISFTVTGNGPVNFDNNFTGVFLIDIANCDVGLNMSNKLVGINHISGTDWNHVNVSEVSGADRDDITDFMYYLTNLFYDPFGESEGFHAFDSLRFRLRSVSPAATIFPQVTVSSSIVSGVFAPDTDIPIGAAEVLQIKDSGVPCIITFQVP